MAQRGQLFAAAALIVGPVQFAAANVVAQLAWTTPYSLAHNNISDLGNVRCQVSDDGVSRYICSPLHELLNTSAVLCGVLLIVGLALSPVLWRRSWVAALACVLLAGGGSGFVLAGLAPADVDLDLHVVGAFLIMGVGNLGLALSAFSGRGNPFAALRVITVAAAVIAIVATWLHFSHSYGPLGMGGSERFALFTTQLWFVVLGAHLTRSALRDPVR
ncbi:DUF998 domain-containing protein [Allokutzneria sp. NRRL B-24872]|uniref:DUF998 domain-containing protein n=1 Tax=Allokutzneria sp. NRRL B-24872 TaxID=1137961 RepID=UPI000A382A56|nr:DUF998 domain-containing protein [Allokutzneria sp. NRRL B-24872]